MTIKMYSVLCVTTSFGITQIVLIALKMNPWICNDVLMDILPFFERVELGLTLALISPHFNALVDAHFDSKSELPLWRTITICKDSVAPVPIAVSDRTHSKNFPLPDRPLHNKIRFKSLQIWYIDHSVIAFLHANQKIWDKGTNLELYVPSSLITDDQPIRNDFLLQIWTIFAPNIRCLCFLGGHHLDCLRRRISPTILTDLDQMNSIYSDWLFPDSIAADYGPNATAGQALSKWLHTPGKDGQSKRLHCFNPPKNLEWITNYTETFLNATTSVSYKIQFIVHPKLTPIETFELANEQTKEKLTLIKTSENHWDDRWIMKRCQIGETTAAVQWEYDLNSSNLNTVHIGLCSQSEQ